ncbi:MAG: ROK family protein [Bacteroidales bacterium]|nr:ROK family protein [Bacteroidales bacterium]
MRLGIDIGGTNIVFGLFGEDGQLVRTSSIRSFARDASLESTLQSLQDRIGKFLTPDVKSIGIGVPSALDRETGVVYNAVNIPSWKNVPLKQILEAHFHVPVRLNNDANCFALGAYRHFAEEKPQSFVGVTLGTGVGLGIVIAGELYNGHNTGAGEIGCIRYLDADLETYCSSPFFTRKGTTCKKAAEAAAQGDPQALALFREVGGHIGNLVATILYAYDPEMLVLGGGISRAFPYFKDRMKACLEKDFIYPETLKRIKIRQLDNDEIALIGAAYLR